MLKNNKLNLLISIVCAIALWAYITTVVNPETEHTISGIPVDLVNVDALNDRGFTVNISENMSFSVDVQVTGARSEVVKLMPADFRATADVAGYRKGTHPVKVNVYSQNSNIEILQTRPDTIDVEIVDLVTVFKPVRLEYEDAFARNQEPGFMEITPMEMEVSGIAEDVDGIDYIRAFVRSGELTEELGTFRLDVVAIDKGGQPVYNVGMSQNTVEVTGKLCYTKTVPLSIETFGEPNESIQVTDMYIPSFITIRGAAEDIEGITEVTGRPVDLSGITATVELPIDEESLNLPEGIEVADASANLSVRIEVQGIGKREFEYTADMIEVRNLQAGFTGHVTTGSVTLIVLAPRGILGEIEQSEIALYVDAGEFFRAGTGIEMEVMAEYEIEGAEISIEPRRVRVTLIRE